MHDPRKIAAGKALHLLLNEKRKIADPELDPLLEELVRQKGLSAAKALFDHLIRTIELPVRELPAPLQSFIQQKRQWPDWAEPTKLEIAHRLFIDHGPKFLLLLYFKSLPTLYACRKGAQVLVQTGRLAHDRESLEIFSRRVAETGQFLVEVMAPGALRPQGPALDYLLKVRIIHSAIRQFIRLGEWDADEYGEPINQEDQALTLLSFGWMPLEGVEKFGIPLSENEKAAYLHAWRVAGHFLGVQPDVLTDNTGQAQLLQRTILQRQVAPSEAGRLLTEALVQFVNRNLPMKELRGGPEMLLHFCLDDHITEALGIRRPYGCLGRLLPVFLQKLFRLEESLEDRSTPLRVLLQLLAQEMMRRMVGFFNHYKDRPFHVPESLQRTWGLDTKT